MSTLSEFFAPSGHLDAGLSGFTYRASQQQMAELVAQALDDNRHAALEAGTGIGKTYAYLVPVLLAGRSAIISTGTRTLQDQLYTRDLPALGAVLGRPVDVALLKGRANYLCWHRLETARRDAARYAEHGDTLDALADWGRASESGDLSRLDDLPDDYALKSLITSTADNCLGQRCEDFERCFVVEARRRAQRAQVVIVNHHLLLADLALKESGFGELLPGAEAVIVDEAHQLPEIAQQFFGVSAGTRELETLARDTAAEARASAVMPDLDAALGALTRRVADARRRVAGREEGALAWPAAPSPAREALTELAPLADDVAAAIEAVEGREPGLERCRERAVAAAARLRHIAEAEPGDGLRWLDLRARSFTAHWTPFDIGDAMASRIADQGGAWIFTSATLAVRDDFAHFLDRIGIHDALTSVLPSPFDYEHNARLYVPEGLPQPSDPEHPEALMAEVWPVVEAAGGGAFLLFTSYRALRAAEQWIARRSAPGPVLVQGAGSRSQLLAEFREAGNAVLLGTGSFWQGVDVRGSALRVLVIDKLPFASPGDPLVQARIEAIRRAGGDAFNEFQLPQAVITLKQGVGRLIRDFDDRGLVVLGDPRINTRGYGRVFVDSLPPMPRIERAAEALEFAASLRADADGGGEADGADRADGGDDAGEADDADRADGAGGADDAGDADGAARAVTP